MKDSDSVKINSVNPLHIIINEVENNGNKYLTFAFTDKNKTVLGNYTKLRVKLNIIPKQ